MKKIIMALLLLLLLVGAYSTWELFGPATSFSASRYDLYIHSGASYPEVLDMIKRDTVLKSPWAFKWLASRMDYPLNVKAGKYELKKDMNLVSILRMLRNGRQVPVNLTITKLRTKQDLASMIGRRFESDSSLFIKFLQNEDSMKNYGLDTNTAMTVVFPNTYTYYWNSTPTRIFRKIYEQFETFWTPQNRQFASQHGLNPYSAYILASIVEEETTKTEDKGKIASVYLNRLDKGMKLAADPTIKFAMRNFELKRIYEKYLSVESPYNTYKYAGLPPGPICTPSKETIQAVINSPKTNYLYFVAKADFSGLSNFSETFPEHLKYARQYQKALDEEMKQADLKK